LFEDSLLFRLGENKRFIFISPCMSHKATTPDGEIRFGKFDDKRSALLSGFTEFKPRRNIRDYFSGKSREARVIFHYEHKNPHKETAKAFSRTHNVPLKQWLLKRVCVYGGLHMEKITLGNI
jgi:hypothetical protein